MILKEASGRQDDICQIERLAAAHPCVRDKADAEIWRIRSGEAGEGSAAHFLNREFRESTRVAVLHDIRLHCGDGDFAQIDHLLIHRVQGTAWILETKNYSGDLHCDEHGDWMVFYNRRPTHVPSPVEQAKRQGIVLERWLKHHEIKGVSRIVPVVLTNPRARISRKHLRPDDHVVKSDNFGRWFQDQANGIGPGTALGMIGRYLVSGMSEMELRHLGRKISDAHQPATFDWATRLGVAPSTGRSNASSMKPSPDIPGNAIFRWMGKDLVFCPSPDGLYRCLVSDPEIHAFASRGAAGPDAGKYKTTGPSTGIWALEEAFLPYLQARLDAAASQLTSTPAGTVRGSIPHALSSNPKSQVQTPFGIITTHALDDGRVALRHARNDALNEAVAQACRGRAQWNPRYRNWIVRKEDLSSIIASIR